MTTGQRPGFADDLISALEKLGAAPVDIPVIQPAEPFLDMAGDDLRRRIFLTENERGESLCLRPEFTIPVCRSHIAERLGTPRRYSYLGQVFRQRRQGGSEFYQAGIEDLGDADTAAADARAMAEAMALLRDLLPGHPLALTMGDQAVFEAVVAALGLPVGWQKRLIQAFGDASALGQMIGRLSAPQEPPQLPEGVGELVEAGDAAELAAYIEQVMEETGYSTHAGRAPSEIAERLIDKSRLERTRLSGRALATLEAFLALEAPLSEAVGRLSDFAGRHGLDIAGALPLFSDRIDALGSSGIDLDAISWRSAFGRPLDYYTGLVFEIAGEGGAVFAGGGRYDRMMELLGASNPIPAVGFSLWIDRIEAARRLAP